MIFAAIDLICYAAGRGRYSPNSLRASGLQLAAKANFAGINEAPAGNTFFLHYRRSLLSWLVMYLTHSAVSHVGIYVGNGYISDVTIAGVKIRPLEEILDGKPGLCDTREICANQPRQVMENIAAQASVHVGKKYNWAAAGWIALQALSDSNYPRQPRHPRLWFDVLIILLLPALPAFVRSKARRRMLIPATAYLLLFGKK